jgi:hypothetical protein
MGRPLINWKGLIFNGCEVLTPINESKKTCNDRWNIKCHCGKIFEARLEHLKSGNIKSCKCLLTETSIKNGNLNRKTIYYNFIHPITKIHILSPVDTLKITSRDEWICLCPHHETPVEFIATPHNIISGNTKSCKCLMPKTNFKNYLENKRIERGLNKDQFILNERDLIRLMLFDPIKSLILKIDNYICQKCNHKNRLHVHHIDPLSNINYNDYNSLNKVFELQNLISLCEECHETAHGFSWYELDKIIQQELFLKTSNRIISLDIQQRYNEIVSTKINPWLDNYLTNKEEVSSGS